MGAEQSGRYNSNSAGIEYEDVKSNPEDVKKYQNDAPQGSFAILASKRPVLLKQVADTLNGNLIDKTVSGTAKGSKLPLYQLQSSTQRGLFYEGQWKNGRQNGRGIVRGVNGTYLQAYFNNGKAEGKGFYIYPDGSYYTGQFKNAHYNGKGLFYYKISEMTYEGQWKDGKPHGKGQQNFLRIGTYKGHFVNGLKHGKGKMQWDDGRQYQGDFYEGYMHGNGVLTKKKGRYQGKFNKNNKVEGVMRTQLGEYNGPFVKGQMSGNGKFTWNNGNVYEGNFKFNKMHGRGKMILKNRQSFEGQWTNGTNIKID